jgi:hypothetical protein
MNHLAIILEDLLENEVVETTYILEKMIGMEEMTVGMMQEEVTELCLIEMGTTMRPELANTNTTHTHVMIVLVMIVLVMIVLVMFHLVMKK